MMILPSKKGLIRSDYLFGAVFPVYGENSLKLIFNPWKKQCQILLSNKILILTTFLEDYRFLVQI